MMTTRTWSLCSDLDGVGTAMITSRVMSAPSSAHPRRVANPSRSPRQADFADPLDFGQVRAFLEADSPRVRCAEHGVIAAQVPWARHGAGHTYAFDDTAAWLVTHCSKSAVRDLLRIAWRTVGSIVT